MNTSKTHCNSELVTSEGVGQTTVRALHDNTKLQTKAEPQRWK